MNNIIIGNVSCYDVYAEAPQFAIINLTNEMIRKISKLRDYLNIIKDDIDENTYKISLFDYNVVFYNAIEPGSIFPTRKLEKELKYIRDSVITDMEHRNEVFENFIESVAEGYIYNIDKDAIKLTDPENIQAVLLNIKKDGFYYSGFMEYCGTGIESCSIPYNIMIENSLINSIDILEGL